LKSENSAMASHEARNYFRKVFIAGGFMVAGVVAFTTFLIVMQEGGESLKNGSVFGLIGSAFIAVVGYVYRNFIRIRRMSAIRRQERQLPDGD